MSLVERWRHSRARTWVADSSNYLATIQQIRSARLLSVERVVVAAAAITYGSGAACSAAWFATGHQGRPGGVWVSAAIAVTSIGLGVAWLRVREWPTETQSLAFVAYANITVVIVVAFYRDAFVSMPGLALLAATGIYVVIHHAPLHVLMHLAFSAAVTVGCFVQALLYSPTDPLLVTVRLLVVAPVVLGVPILLMPLMVSLRGDAIDAMRDSLTGLYNRRGLLVQARDLAAGEPRPLAVLVIDIDKFKSVNDHFGHAVGDRVLVGVATALRRYTTDRVIVARLGGEEFAVVILGERAEANRIAVDAHSALELCDPHVPITVSIGLSGSPSTIVDAAAIGNLIDCADQAMYDAKRHGGAQTAVG